MLHLITNHAIWYKNMQFDTESGNRLKKCNLMVAWPWIKADKHLWSKLLDSGWSNWIFVETVDFYVRVIFNLYFHLYYICINWCGGAMFCFKRDRNEKLLKASWRMEIVDTERSLLLWTKHYSAMRRMYMKCNWMVAWLWIRAAKHMVEIAGLRLK